ncbi:flagellar motor switch protein FliM [Paramicrobacterium agarici]|uniref:Flagellar motor switch protein FliM n=1 Tax=Paramicrobacterium agarici TaxID=630514 RepID=A0A2A9DUY7_9MICO|nr:flagellar motor switch protein FliM [Microbacterium agarici]PFG30597.1 flagellar motor switch protein FliM [Microbacterium agarici]TQO23615.1 flagellar motor switch protein FliM [Microbacterium agarici]
MTVQEHSTTVAPARAFAEVYDFGRPATLAREHSRVLELAFETFARQWATQLTAKIRVRSHVTSEQLSMLTYDEYAASLPSTTAMVICTFPDTDHKAVVQFPLSAALSWIIQMLGGRPVTIDDERTFTPIEQALVRRLMSDALEDLEYSFNRLLPDGIAVSAMHYNSQFAQAAASSDLVIVSWFSIRVGDLVSPASIMLPSELVVPRLSSVNPTTPVDNAPDLMRRQVQHTPVELALRLSPVTLTPREVLDFSVGDVITLPHSHDKPLELVVDGQVVAAAAVGSNGSRLACVVTGPTTTEESS